MLMLGDLSKVVHLKSSIYSFNEDVLSIYYASSTVPVVGI